MTTKKTPKTITLDDVAFYCAANGYSLRDTRYKPDYWLNSVSNQKATSKTVFMCTCGWASERHGCPLHG